jgi:hypothetical protein
MRTIIAGGRDFNDFTMLCESMDEIPWVVSEVVSGTAKGADRLGERWAGDNPVKLFPADWNKHGKAAGHIRNSEMAKYAEALVAFWDGKSKGTKGMIETAVKKGLYVKVFFYE